MSSLRRKWISDPAFKVFKKVLPPLSSTEKEAMEARVYGGMPSCFLASQTLRRYTITQRRR